MCTFNQDLLTKKLHVFININSTRGWFRNIFGRMCRMCYMVHSREHLFFFGCLTTKIPTRRVQIHWRIIPQRLRPACAPFVPDSKGKFATVEWKWLRSHHRLHPSIVPGISYRSTFLSRLQRQQSSHAPIYYKLLPLVMSTCRVNEE